MGPDSELRYIIDIDIGSKRIVSWRKDQRVNLTKDNSDPNFVRIFLTKGQYNKLMDKLK